MTGLVLGFIGFIMFIFYDINQIKGNMKLFKPLFAIGCAMLIVGSVHIALFSDSWQQKLGIAATCLWGLLAVINIITLVYTLFFAFPFDEAYIAGSKQNIYTKGMYALCRHPGVLWMFGFYIFFALFIRKPMMLAAAVEFTALNIFYVWIQDRYIFPKLFDGYDVYRKNVPFLLPTLNSIKNCISDVSKIHV